MSGQITGVSTTDSAEVVNAVVSGKSQDEIAEMLGKSSTKEKPKQSASAEATEETQETQTEETTEESDTSKTEERAGKKPKGNNLEKRFGKLTKRNAEKDREIERLRAENAALRVSKPQSDESDEDTVEEKRPLKNAKGRPSADAFDSHADYVEELARWTARQELAAEKEKSDKVRTQDDATKVLQKRVGEYQEQVRDFVKATPDFQKVLESVDDIELTEDIRDAILDYGPKFAYELSKDPEKLEEICSMGSKQAIREMAIFNSGLKGSSESKESNDGEDSSKESKETTTKEKKEVKPKPAPVSTLNGKSTTSTKNPDDMSFDEYKAWYAKNFPGKV